jgi:hypothetical protein
VDLKLEITSDSFQVLKIYTTDRIIQADNNATNDFR